MRWASVRASAKRNRPANSRANSPTREESGPVNSIAVSIPDDWIGSENGDLNCPLCGPFQTVWSEVFASQHLDDGKWVLLFKCGKCHTITRELLAVKIGGSEL